MTDVVIPGSFFRNSRGLTVADGGGATWTFDPATNKLSVALVVASGSVADHAITNVKLAQMAQATLKGREAGIGTGDAEDLTPAQAKTLLAIAAGDVSGLAASATTDTTNAANISSGTLPAGRLPALTGDVTTGAGSVATTIAAAAVTLAKMANLAANSVIGNNTGSPATPLALTAVQTKTLLSLDLVENTALSAWAGSANITTLGTIATGTWSATAIAANKGGTGQTVYAVGDLLYASTTTALSKLADVAAGSYLRSGGVNTAPIWSSTTLPNSATQGDLLYASAANIYSNLADVAAGSFLRSGGVGANPAWSTITVPNAAVLGDIWYSSVASTLVALTGNTTTTKKFLTQTGNGSVSAAPAWGTIATADLPMLVAQPHVVSVSSVLPAGYTTTYSRYMEIAAGVTLEIGADADLEIT